MRPFTAASPRTDTATTQEARRTLRRHRQDPDPVARLTGDGRSPLADSADITGQNLHAALSAHTDPERTHLHTDAHALYQRLAAEMGFAHSYLDHGRREYVRGDVTTNHALDGTHHHVSREHLPRYLAEFDYRYSARRMSDTQRVQDLGRRVDGRRLTYRDTRRG